MRGGFHVGSLNQQPLITTTQITITTMPDRYGYIAPSRVKVLVVPVNKVSTTNFRHALHQVQLVDEITLLDITPMTELKYFNPQTFPQGKILYDFQSAVPDNESIFLHDFEPSRKTFVVIGLGTYNDTISKSKVDSFNDDLKKLYPSTIVQNTIMFNTPSDKIHQFNPANDHSLKLAFFYNESEVKCSLETIMCEISRNFLFQLDNYANSYRTITLRSPVSITDSQLLAKTITKAQKRLSSGSSSLKVSFANQQPTTTTSTTSSDPKHKTQARHDGRHSKLMASFYLLAGKYVDALNHFAEALLHLRKSDDSMWLGSALEGIGVLVILLNYIQVSYQLPNAVLTTVLLLSKSKIRDMSIDNVSRLSGESLSRISSNTTSIRTSNSHSNNNNHNNNNILNTINGVNGVNGHVISPRNSSSRLSFTSSGAITAGPDLSLIAIPELIKQLAIKVDYYFQLSTHDFENTVPDLVYIESLLRYIKFMIFVYRHGKSMDHLFFESLIKSTRSSSCNTTNPWFDKSDILSEIEKIFSLQLVDLSLIDQCRIYGAIASTYSDLQMSRKKSFILRTLVVALLPQLASSIEQKSLQNPHESSVHNINGYNNSELDDSSFSKTELYVDIPAFGSIHGIRDILQMLFSDYGINSEPELSSTHSFRNVGNNWCSMQILLIKLSIKIFEALCDYESLIAVYCLALTRYIHCLPPDDEFQLKSKVDDLMRATSIRVPYWDPFLVRSTKFLNNRNPSELVPFSEYSNSSKEPLLSLNQDLNNNDQSEANDQTSKSNGHPFVFDPFNKPTLPVMDKDKLLIKDEIYQLKVRLQNPFSFEIDVNDIHIVTDGQVEVETIRTATRSSTSSGTIMNTPSIPRATTPGRHINNPKQRLEPNVLDSRKITSPKVVGSSDYFGPNSGASINGANGTGTNSTNSTSIPQVSLIVPPKSLETFLVPFKPMNSGKLLITGFNIAVGQCDLQYFPVTDSEQSDKAIKVKSLNHLDGSKEIFESVISNLTNYSADTSRVKHKTLDLMVIDPQPSLSLVSLLVTNGWLMLLEGEKYEFSINLTNQSKQIINYLSFSFWDSTIQSLSKRLNSITVGGNNQLSAFDIYEIEWYLLKFKSFKILNKQEINSNYNPISPYQDIKIDYEVTGKKGMTNLKLILEYANKSSELSTSFVKNIEIPLNLTVVPSVELINHDIIPLFLSTFEGITHELLDSVTGDYPGGPNLYANLKMLQKYVAETISGSKNTNISDYCLLVLDLRNSWDEDLQMHIDFQISPNKVFAIDDTLKPKKTFRYLIPMERISCNNRNLQDRIPSLRNKQYVKDYLITEQEELEMRQSFWLRDLILNKISGSWLSHNRKGDMQFRSIRLTKRMINCLIYPKINVLHEVYNNEGQIVRKTDLQFHLNIEEFYTLKTTITNDTDSIISGMFRFIPFSVVNSNDLVHNTSFKEQVNVDKKLLINGLTQSQLPKLVGPGEAVSMEVSFVILENGEYEWGSILDIFPSDIVKDVPSKVVPREPVQIIASS